MSHVRNMIFLNSTVKFFRLFTKEIVGNYGGLSSSKTSEPYMVLPTEIKARTRPIISCLQRTTGPRGIDLSCQRTSLRAAKAISLSAPNQPFVDP